MGACLGKEAKPQAVSSATTSLDPRTQRTYNTTTSKNSSRAPGGAVARPKKSGHKGESRVLGGSGLVGSTGLMSSVQRDDLNQAGGTSQLGAANEVTAAKVRAADAAQRRLDAKSGLSSSGASPRAPGTAGLGSSTTSKEDPVSNSNSSGVAGRSGLAAKLASQKSGNALLKQSAQEELQRRQIDERIVYD